MSWISQTTPLKWLLLYDKELMCNVFKEHFKMNKKINNTMTLDKIFEKNHQKKEEDTPRSTMHIKWISAIFAIWELRLRRETEAVGLPECGPYLPVGRLLVKDSEWLWKKDAIQLLQALLLGKCVDCSCHHLRLWILQPFKLHSWSEFQISTDSVPLWSTTFLGGI